MTDNRTISIREIQHYLYCPRRFALLALNCDWAENASVVRADLMHSHVHDGSHRFSDKNKTVRSDVYVYHDAPEYDLVGKLDCVEFLNDENGVQIPLLNGTYRVRIVEYKPKQPKDAVFHETDAIQVFAQKLCADYVWGIDSEAYLYYDDVRKRVRLPFDTEYEKYDALLHSLLAEMRKILASHEIPPRRKGQHCSGCSIADQCFPKSPKKSVRERILASAKEGTGCGNC